MFSLAVYFVLMSFSTLWLKRFKYGTVLKSFQPQCTKAHKHEVHGQTEHERAGGLNMIRKPESVPEEQNCSNDRVKQITGQ